MHHQPFLSAFNSSTCRQIAIYHILALGRNNRNNMAVEVRSVRLPKYKLKFE